MLSEQLVKAEDRLHILQERSAQLESQNVTLRTQLAKVQSEKISKEQMLERQEKQNHELQ